MISVVLPTRNPHQGRLQRVLAALQMQTLPRGEWELVVVDNHSTPPLATAPLPEFAALEVRIVVEAEAGLTRARIRGVRESRGDVLVFVDDDNVLAPNYLAHVRELFAANPGLGAAGGPVVAEFEQPPPEWAREFLGLLALRDLGPEPIVAAGGSSVSWPGCAPLGAGLCVRRTDAERYATAIAADPARLALDRAGHSLASGGDNDLVFTTLRAGSDVGYFPSLAVTHLIPPGRLHADYLARLNEGIQRTWVRVLALHNDCPWPAIPRWTVPLRSARAWWRERAWRDDSSRIRWRGLHGRFLGQADIYRSP